MSKDLDKKIADLEKKIVLVAQMLDPGHDALWLEGLLDGRARPSAPRKEGVWRQIDKLDGRIFALEPKNKK